MTQNTVEPLNKGHIGIRSTVPCSTVEPLNKGHSYWDQVYCPL